MLIDKYNNQYRKYVNYIKKYRQESNAATASEVDANANVEIKNISTCDSEMAKREKIGYNRLMMIDKLTELYGQDMAEEYIRQLENHEIYKHDETSIFQYCVSITMYPFLFKGLKTIGSSSTAPTNLDSFCGEFINLVFAIAAQFAGAVSTPEFLMYMDYFIRKDYGDDYPKKWNEVITAPFVKRSRTTGEKIEDCFQQVVHSINQPAAARGFQAVFWNIAYFDEPYFKGMFDNFVFPDGSEPCWETVSFLQKRFMKWFNKERTKFELTFPVETMNLLNDGEDCVDKEWADFSAEMYAEGHSFFTYTSNSVDSLASCCFAGAQECLTKIGDVGNYMTFEELFNAPLAQKENLQIFHLGEWKKGKIIRLPSVGHQMYRVVTENDEQVIATDNHIFPTTKGLKRTDNLSTSDFLMFYYQSNRKIGNTKIKSIEPFKYDDEYVYCFEMEDKDEPYFTLPNGIITHNCRLKNELQDNTFSYTLGAGGVSTGSKGVMTININRLVQNAGRDKQDISKAVREQVEKIHKYLIAYNEIVKDNFNARLLTAYDAGYIKLEKQYLTIGINGFVEGAEFLGIDISPNDKYFEYGEMILKPIYESNKAAKTTEIMFNTECVPAENLGVKNAKWDKKDGYFVPRDCYNSYFYKVEDETCNLIDKFILHGNRLTKYLDGGSALHANLEEHLSKQQYRELQKVAIKTGCSYYTYNIPNTVCNQCGYISKHKLDKCPKCGSEDVDYLTRIIGYLKRVSKWSEARQKEFVTRYYAKV